MLIQSHLNCFGPRIGNLSFSTTNFKEGIFLISAEWDMGKVDYRYRLFNPSLLILIFSGEVIECVY